MLFTIVACFVFVYGILLYIAYLLHVLVHNYTGSVESTGVEYDDSAVMDETNPLMRALAEEYAKRNTYMPPTAFIQQQIDEDSVEIITDYDEKQREVK